MQVKKFEAPTIQEALETIKRELGPEAIILQTKKNRRGFGLMSKGSVEVTAAISERAMGKKNFIETRIPEPKKEALTKMSARNQAEVIDRFSDKHIERMRAKRDKLENGSGAYVGGPAKAGRRLTQTRYIDIPDANAQPAKAARPAQNTATSAPMPLRAANAYGAPTASTAPAVPMPAQVEKNAVRVNSTQAITMEEELAQLKRMILDMKTNQGSNPFDATPIQNGEALSPSPGSLLATPALQDAYEQLIVNGVDKRFALAAVKRAGIEAGVEGADADSVGDLVALDLMKNTEVLSALSGLEAGKNNGPTVIALIGPTGVGKTTTAAKIASEALLKKNLKVGLINLDSYKVAAFDQLGTYAKILNVPFRSVNNGEDLQTALQDFHLLDLVLIDTTGRSQRDPAALKEMENILKTVPQLKTQLVLSVTTRDSELYDMATRFSLFRPQGLILSKLDEAAIYGAIFNVSQKVKLPLLYFTTGQRVPEDLEEATKERVAALIMNI